MSRYDSYDMSSAAASSPGSLPAASRAARTVSAYPASPCSMLAIILVGLSRVEPTPVSVSRRSPAGDDRREVFWRKNGGPPQRPKTVADGLGPVRAVAIAVDRDALEAWRGNVWWVRRVGCGVN